MLFFTKASLPFVTFSLVGTALAASSSSSSKPSSTSSAAHQTHTVTVGKATNAFDPDTVEALPGDVIEFQFFPTNHSVIRADYGSPCVPYEDVAGVDAVGFSSGHFAVSTIQSDPPTWSLTINDTEPVFYYCSAVGSCINYQMVGVINPNSTQILSTQKAKAKDADYMLEPGQPFQGEEASSIMSEASAATATVTASGSATTSGGAPLTANPTDQKGLSGGAIAGIAIGGFAVILLAAALFFYIGRNATLKQALLHRNNPEVARSSLPPPPPPAKDMGYGYDPAFAGIAPFKDPTTAHHRHLPSYDVPPYSLTPKHPDTATEELDSTAGSPRASPQMSPRSFGPFPRYTAATEFGNFLSAGSSDPIPVASTTSNGSTRTNTMFSGNSDGAQTVATNPSQNVLSPMRPARNSTRRSQIGPHEMDAS